MIDPEDWFWWWSVSPSWRHRPGAAPSNRTSPLSCRSGRRPVMALVPDCPPGLRVYDSCYRRGYTSRREQADYRSRLLDKIHDSYRRALFLRGGGLCLGLLDPVSNIVANTLVSYGSAVPAGALGEGDLLPVPVPVSAPEEKLRDLDGLVAFLTRLFPYLTDCHAVRFLLLAGADLLAAVRVVASDLGMTRLESSSSRPAVEEALVMALRCAVLAARHPDPDRLVRDWLAISGRLDDTVRILADVRRRSPESSLHELPILLDGLLATRGLSSTRGQQ